MKPLLATLALWFALAACVPLDEGRGLELNCRSVEIGSTVYTRCREG